MHRITAAGTETAAPNNQTNSALNHADEPERAPAPAVKQPQLQSYPSGCVLFARHVPLDTNKTALRARFSTLLTDADALDYIDYTKGLDSVRCTPHLLSQKQIIDIHLLAVLFAPDDVRARAGSAGSRAV